MFPPQSLSILSARYAGLSKEANGIWRGDGGPRGPRLVLAANEALATETSPVGSPFENIEDPYNMGPPLDS